MRHLSLLFLILSTTTNLTAQHFNRSVLDKTVQRVADVEIIGKYVYALVNSHNDWQERPEVYRFDKDGNIERLHLTDTLSVANFLYGQQLISREDGSFLVEGSYMTCDVNIQSGRFFIEFDTSFVQNSFAALSDSMGGYGSFVQTDSGNFFFPGDNRLLRLSSAFQITSSDSINSSKGNLRFQKALGDTALLLYHWNQSDYEYYHYDIATDSLRFLKTFSTTLNNLSDTSLWLFSSKRQQLKIFDDDALSVQDSLGLSGLVNFNVTQIQPSSKALFVSGANGFAFIQLDTKSVLDSGQLYGASTNRKAASTNSAFAVFSSFGNHFHGVSRPWKSQPAEVFEGLEFELEHKHSISTVQDTFSGPLYLVRINSFWKMHVKNTGPETLDSLKLVMDNFGYSCHALDYLIDLDSLDLKPGDSLAVDLPVDHYYGTINSSSYEVAVSVQPAVANGNIIVKGEKLVGKHLVQNISLPEIGLSQVQVFPNPTTDHLNLELNTDEDVSFRITDLSGKNFGNYRFSAPHEGEFSLDLSDLPSGVYFLHMQTNTGSETHRFVKL